MADGYRTLYGSRRRYDPGKRRIEGEQRYPAWSEHYYYAFWLILLVGRLYTYCVFNIRAVVFLGMVMLLSGRLYNCY